MYQNIEIETRRCPRPGAMSWSCNCAGTKKDNYITLHHVTVDGEDKCILCGHYAYRIEKHRLESQHCTVRFVDKRSR